MKRLRWKDIDLDAGTLTLREGKARREDVVPLYPDLLTEVRSSRPLDALPSAPVFQTTPTNLTQRKDFVRAGIALVDGDGMHADLHGLRGTLGTMLAREGAPAQVAAQIMRHRSYSTTLRHYTHLTLADAAKVMNALWLRGGANARPHESEHGEAQADAS